MAEYNQIINNYQGRGLPYRDRNDDIRTVVTNLINHMYKRNDLIIKELIDSYKLYPFIYDIIIDGNNCLIKYDCGEVSFDVFPKVFYDRFCMDVFNLDDLTGQCHRVSQTIIEACSDYDNISAITSLCVNTKYLLFFHSYIYDRNEDKILDFSRRFSMDKTQYDKLFCYKEINNVNYNEFVDKLVNLRYEENNEGLYPLLYLAVNELENKKINTDELCGGIRSVK